MKTRNQSYRNPRGHCAAAILVCLSGMAGAAPIFTESFDSLSQSGTDVQVTTGLKIGFGKSLTGWTKSGDGTIHCVDRTGSGNWAVMFYGGNSVANRNVITSSAVAAANTLNKTYRVTFDLSAANYKNTAQGNNGTTDGVTVTVRDSSGATIQTQTFVPGSFASLAAAGSLPFTTVSFDYVGTGVGTGAASFRFESTSVNVGRFGGSIDNLSVSEPPTLASSAIVDDKGGASVTTGTVVTYTVTFSQDMDDTTVDAADFGNAGTAGVSIGTVTETAPTSGVFTVPVTTTSAGTLQLKVNAGAVLNDAGGLPLNTTSAIADDTTLVVADPGDTTPPTLAGSDIVDDKSGGTVERNALVTYTVTFSEAMDPSTVSAADFGNAGSAAITFGTVTQTSAAVFSVPVTPTTTGTLQLEVLAGAELKDAAGNALVTTSAIPDDTTLTVNDTIPPTLTGIVDDKSPATIAPNTQVTYTVTFSEDMDDATVDAADFGNAGSAAVTINSVTETAPTSGIFTVQATPTSGGTLQLEILAGVELKDAAGNALNTTPAIPDDTTITVDATPPAIAILSPADDATGATLNANLTVTFDEAIAIGTTGNITIKNLSDNSQTTIAITDGTQVAVAGAVLTINPTEDLLAGKDYAIQIDATAVKDLYGNFFTGIADDATWNFTAGDFLAFTSVGTTTWTAPSGVTSVKVLVVGGGGGGGWHAGGGGGAGGLNYSASYAVTPGTSYTVTVGAGGLGSVNRGNPNCDPPTSGGNSAFDTLTAVGGGHGAYSTWAAHFAAAAGGSGGGGYWYNQFGADKLIAGAGTSGQGNAGANGVNDSYSGGGGGAGAAGSTRNGGNGLDYSAIFGTGFGDAGWFAGGGGAGGWIGGAAGTGGTGGGGAGAPSAGSAANGLPNTGGGGGGGGEGNGICGNGGSGIVLLSIGGTTNPYTTWAADFLPADVSSPAGNNDGDSLTNLQEFAFGTDPTVSTGEIVYVSGGSVTPGAPKVVAESGSYSIVFGRRADYLAAGLTYTVQFSAGLDTWADNNDGTNPPVQVATDGTINAMSVPFVDFISTPSGLKKPTFARVKVEMAP